MIDVSILIPVHNCVDLTAACLASLRKTLPADGISWEVLVYDDASTDGTPGLLERESSWVKTVRDSARGSFSVNMNRLARDARGRHLVMLNNDTLLRDGWLEELLAVAKQHPEAGIVGNLHVFPEDPDRVSPGRCTINHAGVVFDADLHGRHLYEGLPETDPDASGPAGATREMQAVSAACWLVDAAHWRALGGFDEAYVNGHEDIDACLRTREMGREVWYAGKSVIEHHGSSTPGRFDKIDENHERFIGRWGRTIEADLERVTGADGVVWPRRSVAYRAARGVWRWGPARAVIGRAMASPFGTRCRSVIHKKLIRTR